MATTRTLIDELTARGLLSQSTDADALARHLAGGPRRVYCGFDPTADSLTIGNLVPIMVLRHFQLAGHTPVVLTGGGTGLIGDPSGKDAERQLQTPERVEANVRSQARIFRSILDTEGSNAVEIVNNAEWLTGLTYIELLRDVGKHFSVNAMMMKESVRERLASREQGISYTEFSYMILQSYDFLHLYNKKGVTVQVGGSDQWGNITAGIELIRKVRALEGGESDPERETHGLVAPLVTKADGGKFGKTESGAVWLTPERTSAYEMYQFWLNTSDGDAVKFLKVFTLMPTEEIEALAHEHEAKPQDRLAQKALAELATSIVHSKEEKDHAVSASRALFTGEVASLDEATIEAEFRDVPSSEMDASRLEGEGVPMVDLLVETGLAKSKREAREHLGNGAVRVNGKKVGVDDSLVAGDLLHGKTALIRRGKKAWHMTTWA